MNGDVYLVADVDYGGAGLFRSDGTAEGTEQLRGFSMSGRPEERVRLANVNGMLYFSARHPQYGEELWKSDGTATGTVLVKDIQFGGSSSYARNLTNVAGTLYFTANNGDLWKSDGTTVGTQLVKTRTGNGTGARDLTAVGSTLFFTMEGAGGVPTLWKSNGTSVGTIPLGSRNPEHLVNVGGTLFFKADDVGMEDQLFRSDGTAPGTMRAGTMTVVDELTNHGGTLYFHGRNGTGVEELWRTDGTIVGTIRLATFEGGSPSDVVRDLTVVGNALYFVGKGPFTHTYSVWRTDGTHSGTISLEDPQTPTWFYALDGLTNVDGTLYFRGGSAEGRELWKTNGSPGNASLVKDVNPAGEGLGDDAFHRVVADGKLYLAADDGARGVELWASDGTAAGTQMVVDLPPFTLGSEPREFTEVNGTWYFIATSGENGVATALWATDGTRAGTRQIIAPSEATGRWHEQLINANGVLYFTAFGSTHSRSLWRTDGTETGTVIVPGGVNIDPRYMIYSEGALYFASYGGDYSLGSELWKYDVSADVVQRLTDVNPGSGSTWPRNITPYDGSIYFTGNDGTNGRELWKYDGAGSSMVKQINPGPGWAFEQQDLDPISFPVVNGVMLFVAKNGDSNYELWRSDGTESGTVMVKDVNPGVGGSQQSLVRGVYEIVGDVFYFRGYDPTFGQELWRSDGTAEGTVRVKDIIPGADGGGPLSLVNVNGTLYFSAYNSPYQLWKSDGTEAGTTPVTPANYFVEHLWELASVGGTLYMLADDGVHGREIWTSQGTFETTSLLVDLAPGSASSYASGFRAVNGAIYFVGDDGAAGTELWRLASDFAGDYTDDEVVDGADFLAWQRAFGSSDQSADGDGDGSVGGGDLDVWRDNYGLPGSASVQSVVAAVSAALIAEEEAATGGMSTAEISQSSLEETANSLQQAREAIFAAGDFSRLFGLGGEGDAEPSRRRGRAPLVRRG